jgi:hypothetical protein
MHPALQTDDVKRWPLQAKRRYVERMGGTVGVMPHAVPTIIEVMESPDWFATWFQGETWDGWKAFLCGVFGLPMTAAQLAIWTECTQRHEAPVTPATEAFLVVGRRGGKSNIVAFIAVYLACFRNYLPHLSRGEWATIPVISADKKESRTVMRYVKGFLEHPKLAARVVKPLAESVEFINRVQIEVHVARFKAVRSYTVAAAICDEIAFWETGEDAASPDSEVLNALRPAMGTIPGALMLGLSSPYARAGVLWEMYSDHFGKDDPEIIWQAPTLRMNPRFDQTVIAKAYEKDPDAAGAEYGAEFRRDIESFVSREAVEACVVPDRRELLAVPGLYYVAFVDPSGGSQDSMTLAVAHRDEGRAVLDAVRERKPPFNPSEVVSEFATLLKTYRICTVTGDRYAGEWPREQFRHHGIDYRVSEKVRSDLYRDLLPLLNSAQVELLDNSRLFGQLCSLERRTARGGKDSIDHAPGAHDDIANAAAGAVVLAHDTAGSEPVAPVGDTQVSYWRAMR